MLLIVHLTLVKCDLIVFWECQEGGSREWDRGGRKAEAEVEVEKGPSMATTGLVVVAAAAPVCLPLWLLAETEVERVISCLVSVPI